MKLSALAAVATAAVLVSSCTQTADRARLDECRRTHCKLDIAFTAETDENAKLRQITITKSSGVAWADRNAADLAYRSYLKGKIKPRKNFTYRMVGQVQF